ncbi:MAG: DUF5522 domain-containing protein [Acidimicrobiales bacterium]
MANEALRRDWLYRPRSDRIDPADPAYPAAMAAHRHAIGRGSLGYTDPETGLLVMTAVYLRDRGWCCDRGCRHCPYVPIPDIPGSESERTDE